MKTIFKNLRNRPFFALAVIVLATCFSACNKNSADTDPIQTTYLGFINSWQNSAPQDVYVNNAKTSFTLYYGQIAGYYPVTPAAYTIAFNAATTSTTTASASETFVVNNFYTVYYVDDSSLLQISEDRTRPQTGKARISFVHLSSAVNTFPLDVYATGGNKIATALYYKTATGYMDVDPATTSFSITASGSSTVLLNMPVSLYANHLYLIYISGTAGNALNYHLVPEDYL